MNFDGHVKVSLVTGAATGITASSLGLAIPFDALLLAVFAFMGGLFPDLDTHSKPSKYAARIGLVTGFILLAKHPYATAVIGMLFMATKVDNHRGMTHSWITVIGFLVIGQIISFFSYAVAFSIGVASHLLADKYSTWKKTT
jgi:uncharacterized metal-binding protein